MKIELFRYRLPLTAPTALRHTTLSERTGFLICLTSGGEEGWGEAAPLPGFSRETEAEVLHSLKALRACGDVSEAALDAHPSSVRFAVESALLDLGAQQEGKTMADVLHPHPVAQLPLNALVTTSGEHAVEEVNRLIEAGYRTVKLKVGRGSVEDDIRIVQCIQRGLSVDTKLRLDANRAWSFEEALRFASSIDPEAIEYLEEPLAEPSRLGALVEATGLPLALDESLVGLRPDGLAEHHYAQAIVLKPSVGGGLYWAARMAERARELGMVPVVSNAFESGVGLRAHVALAAALAPAPAGLSTYRRFAEDVFPERLSMDGPSVDVAEVLAPRTPDLHKLERIP